MLTRRNMLKLSVGATVAWILGACNRGSEEATSTPTLMASPTASLTNTTVPTVAATVVPTSTPPPVVSTEVAIPGSETHVFQTSTVKREYRLYVALPSSYATSDIDYPVLYVLDANDAFIMVHQIARLYNIHGVLPELIIVGIGYNVPPSRRWDNLRVRDYTPTYLNKGVDTPGAISFPTSGKAETFLQIIREEIKPFINEHYRADPLDAAIVGHSAGGLFGLYSLFHHPDTFQRYILGSPSIWWDDSVTLTYEDDYAADHDDLPAKLFMGIGGLEGFGVNDVHNLAEVLQARNYANLEVSTAVFEDEGHLSVVPAYITRGLLAVYKEDSK